MPLTDVKRILKNKPEFIRDTEREVLNYNKALVELNKLIEFEKITLNVRWLERIQKRITEDLIEKYRSGHTRKEPVSVNVPRTEKTIYWPPDHQEVIPLLKDLFDFLKKKTRSVDPLILAGIFHKQFVNFRKLIDLGLIVKAGKGRATYYKLK